MRSPYDVLGVDRRADQAAIKSAFRKLAKKYHPDQNPDDKKAQTKFAEVNQAYEIIGDEKKRAQFDRGEIDAEGKEKFTFNRGFGAGFGGPEGSPFGQGGSSFGGARRTRMGGGAAEDILSDLFGSFGGGAARGGSPFGNAPGADPIGDAASKLRRGADVEAEVTVSIEDVLAGEKATATLPDGRKLAVKLPVGVRDGQTIRLRGQGESAPNGKRGDARITVRFAPHPLYRVDGANLRTPLDVPLQDAVLGAKLPVQTPSGRVAVTIPPMTSSDKIFRLKGRGLPTHQSGKRGDLLVEARVMLGEDDPELTALMEKRRVTA